jgi:toxin FitB
MIVLDTNVVSDFFVRRPNENVLLWMNNQELAQLFIPSVVFAELYYGAYFVVDLVRQEGLISSINQIRDAYAERMIAFNHQAAQVYGRISARRQRSGHALETKDAMIAAICILYDASLATRNTRDFDGLDLKLINPFEAVD